ncbi:MAG: hypothetical protein ABSA48_12150 [Terracidiphilus sp.]|jgi:hypothetical protein
MNFTLTKFRLCADNGLTIFKGNIHLLPLKEAPVLRIASLMSWPLKSIFFALCLPFFLVGIAWAQDTETEIDYTGSLLGYYRVEPIQGAPVLTPVSKFIAALNQQQGHLLLGMGDNFGPEFGASLQLDGGPNSSCPLPPNIYQAMKAYRKVSIRLMTG